MWITSTALPYTFLYFSVVKKQVGKTYENLTEQDFNRRGNPPLSTASLKNRESATVARLP